MPFCGSLYTPKTGYSEGEVVALKKAGKTLLWAAMNNPSDKAESENCAEWGQSHLINPAYYLDELNSGKWS